MASAAARSRVASAATSIRPYRTAASSTYRSIDSFNAYRAIHRTRRRVTLVDAIIYCRTDDGESEVMRDYLRSVSVGCRVRHIDNGDSGARREWEDLDGEVTPLLVMGQRQI